MLRSISSQIEIDRVQTFLYAMIKSTLYLVKHLVKHFPSYPDTSSVLSFASCCISRTKEGAFWMKRSLAILIVRAWRIASTLPLYCSIIRERGAIVSAANYHRNRGRFARCPLCTLKKKNRGRRALYMYVSTRTKGRNIPAKFASPRICCAQSSANWLFIPSMFDPCRIATFARNLAGNPKYIGFVTISI